jgi:uncharacterized protein YndB with AHSA1/START domain
MRSIFITILCSLGFSQFALGGSPMIIDKSYDLPFAIDKVYAAWVDSDTVIAPATRMDIKPEVGGHYRLFMDSPDFTASNQGEFLRVEPGTRVTYTWEWNRDGEVSTIDVTFAPTQTGTRVRILHDGFTKPESVTNHSTGWDSYIEGFRAHLSAR